MAHLADLAARGEGDSPQARAVAQQLQEALKVKLLTHAVMQNCILSLMLASAETEQQPPLLVKWLKYYN